MRRREFIALIGGAAAVGPLAARAQQRGKVFRVGVLETTSPAMNAVNLDAFRQGLRQLGYVEGQNLVIEYRSADGRGERFADLVAELVRLNVDVIVTRGTPAVRAAKAATGTIPVVMAANGDPLLVVGSLARPDGNITGLSAFNNEIEAKRLELIREIVPGAARVAALYNMSNPIFGPRWRQIETISRSLGINARLLDARKLEDIGRAFDVAVAQRIDALLVSTDGFMQANRKLIAELALKHRLPAIYPGREFVAAGGLMAYAVNYPDLYHRAATYVDKILKGAKPSDLPIEQPTKLELVINLKAAKAIGLTIPELFLLRADEVIE